MRKYKMKINDRSYEARIVEFNDSIAKITVNGIDFDVEFESDTNVSNTPQVIQVERTVPTAPEIKKSVGNGNDVKAPLPGVILSIKKNEGDAVKVGDLLFILEAMKMESEISSPIDGVIEKIHVREKASVQEGDVLLSLSKS